MPPQYPQPVNGIPAPWHEPSPPFVCGGIVPRRHSTPSSAIEASDISSCAYSANIAKSWRNSQQLELTLSDLLTRKLGMLCARHQSLVDTAVKNVAHMAQHRIIALSNPRAGREIEYVDWYVTRHIRDLMAIDGVVGGQFFTAAHAAVAWRHLGLTRLPMKEFQM
jgi:hypothetical protein